MLRTYLYGGVGNQLFQYFLLYPRTNEFEVSKLFLHGYTTQNSSIEHLIDFTSREHSIDDKLNFQNSILRNTIRLASRAKLFAKIFDIKIDKSNKLFDKPDSSYFGYWHRAELFEPFRENILAANWRHDADFLKDYNREVVLSEGVYVLHVRKGDYLLRKNKKIFSDLNVDFYLKGFEKLSTTAERIIICTDDKRWICENLARPLLKICDKVEMSSSYGCQSWVDDFLLMRFARNLIMSNSTFAWWAAFLNKNNIYFPRRWYVSEDSRLKLNSWSFFGEKK